MKAAIDFPDFEAAFAPKPEFPPIRADLAGDPPRRVLPARSPMTIRRFLLAALAALVVICAAPAMAKPVKYRCTLDKFSPASAIIDAGTRQDWWIELQVDERARQALVLDPMIQQVIGAPVPAAFTRRDSDSFALDWTLWNAPIRNTVGGKALSLRAVILKQKNQIALRAHIPGGGGQFFGSGRCGGN